VNDTAIQDQQNHLIEIIGELVEDRPRLRRIAEQEIIERDTIIFNARNTTSFMAAAVEIARRLANHSTYYAERLLNEPEPLFSRWNLVPRLGSPGATRSRLVRMGMAR
jgi:hypothetical protein